MCNDEKQIKHLEFIQSGIARIGKKSFQIKGMFVTIISAFLGFYVNTKNLNFLLIAIIPTFLFWFLDAYYLQQSRKFRGIYDVIIGVKNVAFQIQPFEMPLDKFYEGKYSYCDVFFSKTKRGLYGTVVLLLVIFCLVIKFKDCIIINCVK